MSRIDKLTPEQKALVPKWRERWLQVGLCTEPADRRRAESAIMAMRALIGVTDKPCFVWCDSPATAILAINILKDPSLGDSLWDSLRASLGASLGACCYGQHESYWIAFYGYCRDVLQIEYESKRSQQLDLWDELAQSCGWWWCYQNYVIVTERQTRALLDDRGRLHCDDGSALAFRDGWAVYAVHGVRVPEHVVAHPETITVREIDSEPNLEIRRVMITRYGQSRYLRDSGATLIHEDDWGTLYRKEIPNDEPLIMVKVVNSMPEPDGSYREFFLRVDPECRPLLSDGNLGEPQTLTALNAVASTFGKTGPKYKRDLTRQT